MICYPKWNMKVSNVHTFEKALKANLAAGCWEANTRKETPIFGTYRRYKFVYVERYNPDVFCKEPNYNICCEKDEKEGGG